MRRSILGAGLLLWVGLAAAAEQLEFGPIPAWVKPVEPPAKVAKPSEAAILSLLQDRQYNFGAGADESFFESVMRIQTPQGLEALGTLSLAWKPDTDVLTVHKVHVLRGGQVIDVLGTGQTFTILRRENNLEYAALDGVLTAVIQPTGLQVGDTLDFAFTLKRSEPVLAGRSEQFVGGWSGIPIARASIRARWPSSDPIRWKASPFLTGVKEKRSGGFTEVMVSLEEVEPLVQPKGAPLRFFNDRQLEFSEFESWAQVAGLFAPLYAQAATFGPQSALNAEVARIKATVPQASARAAAALELVQDQVRYVFLGMNDGALVPASADLTWTRRFGDCKAKTALLLSLLRALDIQAEPVAVSTVAGDGLDARLPMIEFMNHVVVRATLEGKVYWLDGTRDGDRRLEDLTIPPYHWGLPLVASGAQLVPLEPLPLSRPNLETAVRIDASAGIYAPAPFSVERVLRGDAATNARLKFANVTPADLDRGLREFWSRAYDFVKVESVSARFDEPTGEYRMSMSGSAAMDWEGDKYLTDGLRVGFNADYERQAGPNSEAPFVVVHPFFTQNSETILLPWNGAGFAVDGEDVDRTIAGVEIKRKANLAKGTFTAMASSRSIAAEFPHSEAAAAQKSLRSLSKEDLRLRAPANYAYTDQDAEAERSRTPETAAAYVTRGNMLMNRKEYDDAIADFDKALEMDPKEDMALADRALAHFYQGRKDLAVKDLDAASALNPRNPVVFRGRGMLAFSARKFAEAAAAFTRSLEIQPGDGFTLDYRARARMASREWEAALADSAELLRIWPEYVELYRRRAWMLRALNRNEEAAREAAALIAAMPGSDEAHATAGEIYFSLKKSEEALREFDRLVQIAPTEASYLMRARHRPKADVAGRHADIDAALKLNAKSTRALRFRAEVLSDSGDFAKAAATLTSALALSKDDQRLRLARGIAYLQGGQAALAHRDFDAVQKEAAGAEDLNNICWELAIHNVELERALAACEAALARNPDNVAALDSRAFTLLRLQRYPESIAAYDAVVKLDSDNAHFLYGRGIARRRASQAEAADADISAALARNPAVADEYESYDVKP